MPRVGQTMRCGASFGTRFHTVNCAALENCLRPHAPLLRRSWSRPLAATEDVSAERLHRPSARLAAKRVLRGPRCHSLDDRAAGDTALLGADALAASGSGSRGRSPVTRGGRTRHSPHLGDAGRKTRLPQPPSPTSGTFTLRGSFSARTYCKDILGAGRTSLWRFVKTLRPGEGSREGVG